jgi:hypothetical protein
MTWTVYGNWYIAINISTNWDIVSFLGYFVDAALISDIMQT